MNLEGMKVSVSREGKFGETQSGKISLDSGRFGLKKLLRTKDLFGLDAVQALEHRGKRLVVRVPGTFFVIEFSGQNKDDTQHAKTLLAQSTGVAITGDANAFVLEKEHMIGGAVVAFALLFALAGGGKDKPVSTDAATNAATPVVAPATKKAADPTADMARTLWTIDGGSRPQAEYRGLLDLIHQRFPTVSTTKIGDMAAKTRGICAKNGRAVPVISPLYALKNATDGFSPAEFKKMFTNNPPHSLLAVWVATGCN
jgi:hypothetical protein